MSTFASLLDLIYPALDEGKYDTALQLCLKPEVSKFTLGKALLAYTYSCLRNNAKAMEIARVVAAAQPAEDSVVSTLGCTFKVLRAEKEFAELYENAMKKKQMEDSYVLELFSCYCRLNDPKKMQFIAQKFHKAHPNKACYLFWSVTCMMLQDLPPTMLVLAEKMAQKVLYDLSNLTQPSADEMALFAFILVRQGKFAQAYDSLVQLRNRPSGQPFADEAHFAENPNLVKMLDLQVSIHKLDLLIRQGRLAEVMQECKHVLLSQPDQWNVHKVMVDVILNTTQSSKKSGGAPAAPVAPTAAELLEQKQLIFPMQDLSALLTKVLHADNEDSDSETDSAVSSTEPVTAAQMSAVTQHLQYLRQLQANKPKLRGPYLAELYLISGWLQMLQKQDITVLVGESLWIYSDSSAAQAGAGGENLPFNPSESPMVRMAQELASLISQYALRFQTKQCCFSDLRPYLASLHQIEGHHLNIAAAHSSTTTSTNTSLVAATQQWALSQREAVGEKLHAAMSAAIAAKAAPPLVTPEPASAEPATPACTVTAAAQGPAAAEVEAEDADQDDEDAADTTTGASAGSITDTAPTTGGTGGASAAAAAKKKKNKKKKKSAAAKTAAAAASGTVTSAHVGTPSVAEMLERNKGVVDEHTDVLLLLCNYCKFDQIVSYCDTLLLNSSAAKTNATVATGTAEDEMARRVALYSASRELFKLGVGGERRNVQPGDELLLQNSSLYRRAFIQVSTTTGAAASAATGATAAVDIATGAAGDATGAAATPSTAAVGVGLDTDKQKAAVQWARCLLQGKEASPYAFAFKMDLLEPYRALALGEPAHSSFGDMGVKHIQHDSLSYLVLPSLIEAGFFSEAQRQMRCVANFHVAGKRDSLDMLGKAFQYGNYMKVLELSRFVDHCQRSTQLVLSKLEIPLLELTLKHSTAATALKYLQDLSDPKLNDPLGPLDSAQLDSLIDHMDYNLQVRTDQLDELAMVREAALYRRQMQVRILQAQHTSRLLYWALQRDGEQAMSHFTILQQLIDGDSSSASKSKSAFSTSSTATAAAAEGYHQWSQNFHCEAQAALTEASHKCTKFAVSAIATNTVTLSSPPSSSSSVTTAYAAAPVKHAGFSSLDEAVKGARSAVRTLLALHDTLLAQPAQVNRLVSAPWVRNTSAFVRTLGTEVPLLMQVCLAMYSSRSSSGTPAGVSAECSAAEVDALLQGITSPPLTPAAVLGQLSELISAVFLNILGKLKATADKVKADLGAATVGQIAASLNALEGRCTASPASSAATDADERQEPLSMSAVSEVIDLCSGGGSNSSDGGGDDDTWSATATAGASSAVGEEEDAVVDAVVVQSAPSSNPATTADGAGGVSNAPGKADANAPKESRDVSAHADLQAMVAAQMKSSYSETCTRLAGLMQDRIDALSSALKE